MSDWIAPGGTPGLVSVVIPTHNRSGLLGETLASVLAQTHPQVEAVVVDDGSSDDTMAVLESWRKRFQDERGWRLQPIKQTNSGSPAARNAGVRASRGQYLAFLDDDDLLSVDFLAGRVAAAAAAEADVAYGPSVDFAVVAGGFALRKRRNESPVAAADLSLAGWLRGDCFWYAMSAVFTRDFAVRLGPWDEALRRHEDIEFLARCFRHAPKIAHSASGFLYRRVHPETKSRSEQQLSPEKRQAYEDNLIALASAVERHALAAADAGGLKPALAQHLGEMAAKSFERGFLRSGAHCARQALAHDPDYRPDAKWSTRAAYALGGFKLWGAKNRTRQSVKRSLRHMGIGRDGYRLSPALPGCAPTASGGSGAGAGRRLAVVHIIGRPCGTGPQNSPFYMIRRLDRERFDVTILSLKESDEWVKAMAAIGYKAACVEVRGLWSWGGLLRLARLLRGMRADVVHTHLRGPNLLGQIAAVLARVPVRVAHLRNMDGRDTAISRLTDRIVSRLATKMIAVSPLVARLRVEQAGVKPERIVTILNAIDLEVFVPGDRQAARAALGIGPEDVVAGYSGRLHPRKNVDVLLRAFAEARKAAPSLRLLLAGDGELREELERLAVELGVDKRVTFLGQVKDMPPAYAAMDVFCLISSAEGCSRAMLEAAAMELPLVATPVGFAEDLVGGDGRVGVVVPVREEKPLTDALVRLASDAGLRRDMGAAARELARKHDIIEHVREIERLYLRLWSEGRRDG